MSQRKTEPSSRREDEGGAGERRLETGRRWLCEAVGPRPEGKMPPEAGGGPVRASRGRRPVGPGALCPHAPSKRDVFGVTMSTVFAQT